MSKSSYSLKFFDSKEPGTKHHNGLGLVWDYPIPDLNTGVGYKQTSMSAPNWTRGCSCMTAEWHVERRAALGPVVEDVCNNCIEGTTTHICSDNIQMAGYKDVWDSDHPLAIQWCANMLQNEILEQEAKLNLLKKELLGYSKKQTSL